MTVDAGPIDLGIALDYYSPYVSGLSEVARLVAEGLVERGYRVEVVCGRHDRDLDAIDEINGVTVRRCPVVARFDKALIQPSFPVEVARMARRARLLQPHLPLPEGLVARWWRAAPIVPLYHCDAVFPPGPGARLQRAAIDAASARVLHHATEVVVTSDDYLAASRIRSHITVPVNVIPPPVPEPQLGAPTFRRGAGPHLGFLGRIVAEKGLDVLLAAMTRFDEPELRLLIGGDFTDVAGRSVIDDLRTSIAADPRVELLGFVPEDRIGDFLASIDLFVLPSVNRLEAFGITQVEAMLAGVPVVASDLPGVRVPVTTVGVGKLARPGDPAALADAIRAQLADRPGDSAIRTMQRLARDQFGREAVLDRYEELMLRLRR